MSTLRDKLLRHVGHDIVCVTYGDSENPADVCIECEDCNEVLVSAETDEYDDREYEVTEVCPHCGSEVTLMWNVEADGYKAFCPYCGERLMLCDACLHTEDENGECDGSCDYCRQTDSCKYNLPHTCQQKVSENPLADLEHQLKLLHNDGYQDAEKIIRYLMSKFETVDMCENPENTLKLTKMLRAYAKDYASGKTLGRAIVDTEKYMEQAADVIDFLSRRTNARKAELDEMKNFVRKKILDELGRDRLRSLWTSYCLRYDLCVDTTTYEMDMQELWGAVSDEEPDTADWGDFDSFEDFMCAYLA